MVKYKADKNIMKSSVNINIVVGIIVILSFIGGLLGTWYNNKQSVALLEQKLGQVERTVNKNTKTLETYNLELLNYKLDEILKRLDK